MAWNSYIARWGSAEHEGQHEYLLLLRAMPEDVFRAIDEIGPAIECELRVIPPEKARVLVLYQSRFNEKTEFDFTLNECPIILWDASTPAALPEILDSYFN